MRYVFETEVEVTDAQALFYAAFERAIDNRLSEEEAAAALKHENCQINVPACLQMLFDPGLSPPGCEIQYSACEPSKASI